MSTDIIPLAGEIPDHDPGARVSSAEQAARDAEARAREAHYRLTEAYIRGQEAQMSALDGYGYGGGGAGHRWPGRLDTPWQRTTHFVGEARYQDPLERFEAMMRAQSLVKNNWLACGTLDRAVENVIGTTIRIEPRTSDKAFNKAVKDWWKERAYLSASLDIKNRKTFGGIWRAAYRAKKRDGGSLQVLVDDADQLRVQHIAAERITTPFYYYQQVLSNGNRVIDGIEINRVGRTVAYHVRYTQPDMMPNWVRVPAENAVFLKQSELEEELHGMTTFEGGFSLFDQIAGVLEAVVTAWRIGASAAMFLKKRNPTATEQQMRQAVGAGGGWDTAMRRLMEIHPGMIHLLDLDESIGQFDPKQPTQNFPDALDAFCRILGTKWGLTLEGVLLNFGKTTYSSGKMAINQASLTASIEQEDIAVLGVGTVYRRALVRAIESGEVDKAPPKDWNRYEWIPQARPSPEPLKDAQASQILVAERVETRSNWAMTLGYDFTEQCEQHKVDNQDMADNDVTVGAPAGGTPSPSNPKGLSPNGEVDQGKGASSDEEDGKEQ